MPADSSTFFYRNFSGPNTKLMNTHMHLLEAFTNYYRLTGEESRRRLVEVLFIESNAVLRKGFGANTDGHGLDWTPLQNRWSKVVYYGHDLENSWLLMEACRALDLPNGPLVDLYRSEWDYNRVSVLITRRVASITGAPGRGGEGQGEGVLGAGGESVECVAHVSTHRRCSILDILFTDPGLDCG